MPVNLPRIGTLLGVSAASVLAFYLALTGAEPSRSAVRTITDADIPVADTDISTTHTRPPAADLDGSKAASAGVSADDVGVSTPMQGNVGEQVVNYAATLLGTPYKVAGKDESGFDCSGFISYVFRQYNVNLPPSTSFMIKEGYDIPVSEAGHGDIVFFTGTEPGSLEVGHAGIVVSQPGKVIRFIHSSSGKEYCVKYNDLTSEHYKKRFLKVKRML